VFQPNKSSRCHLRRNPRRTFRQKRIEMITFLLEAMKPLSFLNLLTQQTKSGELPPNPNHSRASAEGPSLGGNSQGSASGSRDSTSRGDGSGEGSSGRSSSHGAGRRAGGGGDRGAEAMQTATSPATHVAASPPTLLDFAIYSSLRNSSLLGSPSTTRSKTQCSGLGATPYPLKTLVATMT
jgi:hypothetical protein